MIVQKNGYGFHFGNILDLGFDFGNIIIYHDFDIGALAVKVDGPLLVHTSCEGTRDQTAATP